MNVVFEGSEYSVNRINLCEKSIIEIGYPGKSGRKVIRFKIPKKQLKEISLNAFKEKE